MKLFFWLRRQNQNSQDIDLHDFTGFHTAKVFQQDGWLQN